MSLEFFIFLFAGMLVLTVIVVVRHLRSHRRVRRVETTLGAGEFMAAIGTLRQVVNDNPDDVLSLFKLAELHYKAGQYVEARQAARRVLERNLSGTGVGQVRAVLLLARAERSLGNREEARRNLLIAHGLDGTDAEVNFELAVFEYETGEFSEALGHASRVVKLDPDNAEAHYYRGMAAFQSGRADIAVESLRRTLLLKENHHMAALSLGRLHARAGEHKEAEACFASALKGANNRDQQAQVYYHWAAMQRKLMQGKRAVELLEKAFPLAGSPDLRRVIALELVGIHEEARDVKNVVRMMRLALEIDPQDVELKKKLAYYVELNRNEALRRFEMLPLPQLSEFCARLAQLVSKSDTVKGADINKDGSIDVLVQRSTKTQNIISLFRFMRARTGEIGEMPVRDLYAKMKAKGGEKAYFVSNVKYTEGAVNFALTRVVTLVDRDQLLAHLEQMKA